MEVKSQPPYQCIIIDLRLSLFTETTTGFPSLPKPFDVTF
jgi:hypothetical protein